MFAIPTNTVSVWRDNPDDVDERGDPTGEQTKVIEALLVSISESRTISDQPAGDSERTIHIYAGKARWGADVRKGDRLYDAVNFRNYHVTSVTKTRSPMHKADLNFELRSEEPNS